MTLSILSRAVDDRITSVGQCALGVAVEECLPEFRDTGMQLNTWNRKAECRDKETASLRKGNGIEKVMTEKTRRKEKVGR